MLTIILFYLLIKFYIITRIFYSKTIHLFPYIFEYFKKLDRDKYQKNHFFLLLF
jgi:hypothetical protein